MADDDAFYWHTNPDGGLCDVCGAVAPKGRQHRALKAHEMPKWPGALYIQFQKGHYGRGGREMPLKS